MPIGGGRGQSESQAGMAEPMLAAPAEVVGAGRRPMRPMPAAAEAKADEGPFTR
jgi:hypothetical protein